VSREGRDLELLEGLLGGKGLEGPGDDAALLRDAGDLLLTMDPLVEGVHFEVGTSVARVAHKLLHRNLSDLAAMGARPRAILASFVFGPTWVASQREELYARLAQECESMGVAWIGGDLSSSPGPAVLTLCALGSPSSTVPIPRSGLRPGMNLHVSGPLGGSLPSGRHLDFEARVELGVRLAEVHRPAAMMDISDGLALDLGRMLRASGGLGATLYEGRIPLHKDVDSVQSALGDGEDYELLFALEDSQEQQFCEDAAIPAVAKVIIGRVEGDPGLRLQRDEGGSVSIKETGFEHELS